jgi:vacuolar-type H+-ATPase subunit H
MNTRSKTKRKAVIPTMAAERQLTTSNEGENEEINNQLGLSGIYEEEELSVMTSNASKDRARGLGIDESSSNQDKFQQKLLEMLQMMQDKTEKTLQQNNEHIRQNNERIQQQIQQNNEHIRQNNEHIQQQIQQNTEQIKQNAQEILQQMQARLDTAVREFKEEAKADREAIKRVTERLDCQEQKLEGLRAQSEKTLQEVKRTKKEMSDNLVKTKEELRKEITSGKEDSPKHVHEVEARIHKQYQEVDSKAQKIAEEKAKRIDEVQDSQETLRRRLTAVEARPINQGIHGERPKEVTFNGTEAFPMEFLKELEEVKEMYYPGNAYQWISRHLEGDAMTWWRVVKHRVTTYQQFREAFIAKYWNTQVQEHVRDGLEYGRYHWGGTYNVVQYLEHRILECRNIIPPIPGEHLIRKSAFERN